MEKIKCKICGTEFDAKVIGENHYIAREEKLNILTGDKVEYLYDAFECPVCKCQNILGERYKKHIVFVEKENKTLCDRCDKQDEECHCDCAREFVEKEKLPECYGDYKEESKGCSVCKLKTKCKNETKPKCFGEYSRENIACVEKCDVMHQCKRAKLYGCFSKFEDVNDTCMNHCEFSELCNIRSKGNKNE